MNEELLRELNEAQKEVVIYNDGNALVIAGAGSGKTRVLVHKIAYLLQNGYTPNQLMALTFTNKAAKEMKSRIQMLLPHLKANMLWMGTFHSIFLRILRENAVCIGFPDFFSIYDESDVKSLLKSIFKEMKLDEKQYKYSFIRHCISEAKNSLLTPANYIQSPNSVGKSYFLEYPFLGKIYATYTERCKSAGAMDFDDILLYTHLLFKKNPEVLDRYRERFRYILVDEYQDTNLAQHTLIEQIVGKGIKVCAVGDDAQSIYSFRGADIDNILNFRTTFGDCKLFKLEQNYRSTQHIVNASNSLIKHNKMRIPKKVFSTLGDGEKIRIVELFTELEEASWVANKINELYLSKHNSLNDYAILYRTNAQSRTLEDALRKKNLPYRIYGGIGFYQRKEVKDILSYLRLIVNPNDEEAFLRAINTPSRGIGIATISKLHSISLSENISFWDILSEESEFGMNLSMNVKKKLFGFRVLIEELIEDSKHCEMQSLLQNVLVKSGLRADIYANNLPESLDRQQIVEEFIKSASEYSISLLEEEGRVLTLPEFLSEISLATDQDRTEEEEENNKITLMTVHAAKGLEFENIFVVGMQEDLFPYYLSCKSSRELEEERRLFYVAITRAKRRCFLSYSKKAFRFGDSGNVRPSRFLSDIDPSCVESSNSNISGKKSISPYVHYAKWNLTWDNLEAKKDTGNSTSSTSTANTTPSIISKGDELKEGSIIKHERFGVGEVLSIEGEGNDKKIVVRFQEVGTKILLLRFVKYTLVKK
ncbi:MAG TPA: ATP-dependent DNA helicase [Porphyromonadaceae bacterium]|nr:ATP-dependent DNA helicase [Porphyromonadaceae bacterium]